VVTQEELPLNSPSSFFQRTAYLVSAAIQTPVVRPAIQTRPQWPQDAELLGNAVYEPTPAPAPPLIANPKSVYTLSRPDLSELLQANASLLIAPIPVASTVTPSYGPPHLELEEVRGPPPDNAYTGVVRMNWLADPAPGLRGVHLR
jgi:hypothetical protein